MNCVHRHLKQAPVELKLSVDSAGHYSVTHQNTKPETWNRCGRFLVFSFFEEVVQFSVFFRCDLESSAKSLRHSVHFVQGIVLACDQCLISHRKKWSVDVSPIFNSDLVPQISICRIELWIRMRLSKYSIKWKCVSIKCFAIMRLVNAVKKWEIS